MSSVNDGYASDFAVPKGGFTQESEFVASVTSTADPLRLAIVVSHPIQHFAPWHRKLAALPGIDLKVFFCRDWGANAYFDPAFGIEIKWDLPLLDGYEFEFLPLRSKARQSGFWGVDNPTVASALQAFKPDVVQLFGYSHRTMWRARKWCNDNDVPVLLYSDSNASEPRPLWKRVAKSLVVKRFYHGVAGALFTGDNNREYHRHYGVPEDRLFQGSLPIDAEMLLSTAGDPSHARAEIRGQYGIPEDAFVLVFSGKLSARKSPLHLVEAVARCGQRGAHAWALIVGEGAERSRLEEFIANQGLKTVVLVGFVNQSSIAKYYASGDVLVSTSAFDPHPLVVPEGGCFGLPVIVSDRLGCIGETDTARRGVNALVYPWSDVEALTQCILQLYENKGLYHSMSAAAREIAHSQDVSVAALLLREAAQKLKDRSRH